MRSGNDDSIASRVPGKRGGPSGFIEVPTAFLLCGPSLAGKSAAARVIAGRVGAAIVSTDEINRRRGLPFGAEGLAESVWAETLDAAVGELREHAGAGRHVVFDDTLCYRWIRERLRRECEDLGLRSVLLVFPATEAELLARREAAARDESRPVLSAERLCDHLRRFEWPTPDEEPLGVRTPGDLERAWR